MARFFNNQTGYFSERNFKRGLKGGYTGVKQTPKTALGGIVAALSVAAMFMLSFIESLTYAAPAIVGAFVVLVVVEAGKKWASAVYVTVSLLSMLLISNKEAAIMYAAFFGYYPILKAALEERAKKWLEWIVKIAVFNAAIVASYWAVKTLMGIGLEAFGAGFLGRYAVPALLLAANAVFLLYDFALTQYVTLYVRRWRKHFKRFFR